MNDTAALAELCARLRACSGTAEAAGCLALALAGLIGMRTCAVGVYLFDAGRQSLLLEARHPLGEAAASATPPIPAWELEDPLAFSVHGGRPCRLDTELLAGLPPSLESLCSGLGHVRCAAVEPLVAPGNVVLGGVVMASSKRFGSLDGHARVILDYASAVMDGAMLRRRHRSVVQGLSEDCARLEQEARDARMRPESSILGQSEAMEAVRSMVVNVSASDVPVLITGETGTGKEVVAAAIHNCSARRQGPFVQINCAALPSNLLESELFGHRKGAFSGAESDHEGLLRSANGGTVLLDEVGDMPLDIQAKLLRVLQEHTVRPVGDVRSHAVNIRVLAATNRDMDHAVEQGLFRRDLYHRLALIHLKLPPLRERLGDLPVLAGHRLAELAVSYRRPGLSIAPEAWPAMRAQTYRGNVRELFSRLERAVIMTEGDVLTAADILGDEPDKAWGSMSLQDLVRAYEASVMLEVMKFYGNRRRDAARALGLPIRTLNHKLRRISAGSPTGLPSHTPNLRSRSGIDV